MIRTIASKELKEIVRDGRFAWTAAIMAILLIAALVTGAERYAGYRLTQEASQAASNSQFYSQGDKNPHSGAHYGNYAFKAAGPLSLFDSGIEAYAGSFVFMEAHKQNLALSPPAGDLSAIARFGDLNGAMILQVLMPLLIIFLGFSTFAGERERGTLRQLLSMGVSKSDLLWGKALGVGAAVALVIVPCIVAGAVVIAFLKVTPSGDAFGARLALMSLAYIGYGLIFLFLTLAVSALASSPRTALIGMVGFWAFCVFLMPKAAGEISKVVHPSPSLGEFQTDMQMSRVKGLGGGPPPRARLEIYKQQLLKKYGVKTTAELPIYWVSTSMQKMEEMDHEIYSYYYNSLNDAYTAQRRVQDNLGVLAPVLPLSSISMGLSGADLLHQNTFTAAAEKQRRLMVETMNGYLSKMAVDFNANQALTGNVSMETNVLVASEAVFKLVPPFRYEPPSLAAVMHEYGKGFAILAAWLVGSIALAFFTVGRLRPQTR
ncbi:MAG: ABC transporter permease subunit [Pseudomonadota bacterium]|uniref:ABC transporter permease subunit n=1 Tax=Phenylobacterium sp. TaxID=1871053 RepID=UPI0025EAD8D2|nr:ABC transporter permease subunit [Phenylobacterium sp.]MBT9470564.1 ABC transporter permease subunit [Phenylobacterium sp.]